MIAGGDAMSCKTVKFPAEAEVGMAMVVLIFANPEKDFPRSLGSGMTRDSMASGVFARRRFVLMGSKKMQ